MNTQNVAELAMGCCSDLRTPVQRNLEDTVAVGKADGTGRHGTLTHGRSHSGAGVELWRPAAGVAGRTRRATQLELLTFWKGPREMVVRYCKCN